MEDETELCRRFEGRIFAYGLRHLRDRVAAQDLVQHVLLAVLTALRAGRVEEVERIDAYVLGTCRNAVLELRRGERRRERLVDQAGAGLPEGYWPESFSGVDRARLEQCLFRLEPRDRAVVVATFVEDQDADEIGEALALTAGNVRVIRHRALARLQACVEGSTP